MKKKIKADSVDELFEIVNAIQNGEEPEAYVKRKAEEEQEAERQREADKKAAALAARQKSTSRRQNGKKPAANSERAEKRNADSYSLRQSMDAEEDDDEAFERLLAEEPESELQAAAGQAAERLKRMGSSLKEKVQSGVHRVEGSLRERSEKKTERTDAGFQEESENSPGREFQPEDGNQPKNESRLEDGNQPENESRLEDGNRPENENRLEDGSRPGNKSLSGQERQPTDNGREREHLADTEKNAGGRTHRRYGAKTVSEEAESVGQRILRSLHMESAEEKPAESPEERREEAPNELPKGVQKETPEEPDLDSIDLDTVQILDRLLDGAGSPPIASESDPEAAKDTASSAENASEATAGSAPPAAKKTRRPGRLSDFKENPVTPDVKSYLRQLLSRLEDRGFGRRQLRIAGVAAVIAVAALVLILWTVSQSLSLHRKQMYVTADKGLTITVENQPEEWCSSCELELKVKVKSGTITSIEIDGVACEADEKGFVTVHVQDYLTNVAVVAGEETLTAQIEIPMVDSSAPIVSVDKSQGKITVTASDARSGVASVWYAEVEDDDWISLPAYQLYTEPIPYEEGRIYYFYAVDQAGNKSSPIVTSMVTAESLSLSETELTLFPGETANLTAEVTPANALVTELSYESSNTDVVTVDSSGLVTAVAEGGALIRVTVDDLDTVTCAVTVVLEQTVSVSAIGDCTLGTYAGANTSTSFDAYYTMYGATYFFENVRDILENDDITFANLEGTLTDETTPVEKTYAFKGDPSYTEILQDGSIEVVTLANNHSSDYGAQSLADTKDNLTDAGIEYCIGDTIAYEEVSGIKVAFIGIYELASGMDCESQVRDTIAEAQEENAQLIIVAFHWGTEKETAADETQQALAHIAIDCGADLVVGHHPHVLQGIEKYNGKYIVYSLGNFCFGGNSNPSDKATIIFRQTFTVSQDGVVLDDNIEIIPCTLSSQTSYNDYRPTPATGTTATEIMDRINEYSAAFGDITYTASTGL